MYLEYAENQALKGVVMYMKDWIMKLDAFLKFNEEAVLKHQGKVSNEVALALVESEFEKYRIVQDKLLESDFDKAIKKLSPTNKSKAWAKSDKLERATQNRIVKLFQEQLKYSYLGNL